MKPSDIFNVMDLAYEINKSGGKFVPLFVGAPGLGKSEIIQQWCKQKWGEECLDSNYRDFRTAYQDAPDLTGFPNTVVKDGVEMTVKYPPEILPRGAESQGVFVWEEPNRGPTSVMNAMMQALTDKKIEKYTFPKGWFQVGAINEGSEYETNNMDPALKNRFVIYDVSYDKKSFVQYMKDSNWDKKLINWVESGLWKYATPEDVSNNKGAKYISPRTLSYLNNVLKNQSKVTEDIHFTTYVAILGDHYGANFHQYMTNESPVFYSDLMRNESAALSKLKSYADPKNYKNSHLSITITDIIQNGSDITDDLLTEVLLVLPADQGPSLVRELEYKRQMVSYSLQERLLKNSKSLRAYLKETLKK